MASSEPPKRFTAKSPLGRGSDELRMVAVSETISGNSAVVREFHPNVNPSETDRAALVRALKLERGTALWEPRAHVARNQASQRSRRAARPEGAGVIEPRALDHFTGPKGLTQRRGLARASIAGRARIASVNSEGLAYEDVLHVLASWIGRPVIVTVAGPNGENRAQLTGKIGERSHTDITDIPAYDSIPIGSSFSTCLMLSASDFEGASLEPGFATGSRKDRSLTIRTGGLTLRVSRFPRWMQDRPD